MAKAQTVFICDQCGQVHGKWSGQCQGCGSWNSLIEEVQEPALQPKKTSSVGAQFQSLEGSSSPPQRLSTGLPELDRVLGGGLVPGSVILVGGDPGIGKSTLLLQVAALVAQDHPTCYISGEEAVDQIRMRAQRLGVAGASVLLASETDLVHILHALRTPPIPRFVVIDSIQTMVWSAMESAAGSVSQVRACSHELIKLAKKNQTTLVLVGHVTKEGTLAGPRVLEHMVDTVLYFEGERTYHYRIVRAVKNRFGATDEMGVFDMTSAGLKEVRNPSSLFLPERDEPVSGSVVYGGMEGSRPLFMEIQALVSGAGYGNPRRSVLGWDPQRLAMILAVLETRCGVSFGQKDVYLNVTGGLRIQEPGADLAVAAALLSALMDQPLEGQAVFFGELSLSGEVRSVSHLDQRLKEAEKLGFDQAFIPKNPKEIPKKGRLKTYPFSHVKDLLTCFHLPAALARAQKERRHGP